MEYMQNDFEDIRVGDIINVVYVTHHADPQRVLFLDNEVTYIGPTTIISKDLTFHKSMCHYFLVKRAKQPLPTAIGRVVEVDGVEYVRVTEDNDECPEWSYREEDYLDSASSENLSDLDYTVV